MNFSLSHSISILERTPTILSALLSGIEEKWSHTNEGPDTWSPYDIVGHLIHGERTDWIERLEIILSNRENKTFNVFDRFAQFRESKGKSLEELLKEFTELRESNILCLKAYHLKDEQMKLEAIHPALNTVTLHNLLATWVVHDLGHLAQISRVMAKQYAEDVGPWKEFLPILTR